MPIVMESGKKLGIATTSELAHTLLKKALDSKTGLFSNREFSNAKVFSLLNSFPKFLLCQGIQDSHTKELLAFDKFC